MPLRYDMMMQPMGGGVGYSNISRGRRRIRSAFDIAPAAPVRQYGPQLQNFSTGFPALPGFGSSSMQMVQRHWLSPQEVLSAPVPTLPDQVRPPTGPIPITRDMQYGGTGSMLRPGNRSMIRGPGGGSPIGAGFLNYIHPSMMGRYPSPSVPDDSAPGDPRLQPSEMTPAYAWWKSEARKNNAPLMPGQIPGGVPLSPQSSLARGGYDERAIYDQSTDSWRARERGDVTLPGFGNDGRSLEQQIQDTVYDPIRGSLAMQRATAQGQLDPGRYAHITGGRPVQPAPLVPGSVEEMRAGVTQQRVPPGTTFGSSTLGYREDGTPVLIPAGSAVPGPRRTDGRRYNEAQRAEMLRRAAINNGVEPGATDEETRQRIRDARAGRRGVRVPGYSVPMPADQAAAIRGDAANRRRAYFGLPPVSTTKKEDDTTDVDAPENIGNRIENAVANTTERDEAGNPVGAPDYVAVMRAARSSDGTISDKAWTKLEKNGLTPDLYPDAIEAIEDQYQGMFDNADLFFDQVLQNEDDLKQFRDDMALAASLRERAGMKSWSEAYPSLWKQVAWRMGVL